MGQGQPEANHMPAESKKDAATELKFTLRLCRECRERITPGAPHLTEKCDVCGGEHCEYYACYVDFSF